MNLHSTVKIDSPTRDGLTLRAGRGVRPLSAHSETPWGASIEQKFAALVSAIDLKRCVYSTMCSLIMLTVHSFVSRIFFNVFFGCADPPENPITITGGSWLTICV